MDFRGDCDGPQRDIVPPAARVGQPLRLEQICFALAQGSVRLLQLVLCSFTLSDVDHSTDKFNEIARRAKNRMSNDVNVPDAAIRMHDAVVCLELYLLADRRLGKFPEPGSVIRMNPLKELFALGQAIGWIETQNTIALLRPVTGSTSRSAPGPTAGLAHLLRFRQVPLTAPEVFLGRLALCDVGHSADKLDP